MNLRLYVVKLEYYKQLYDKDELIIIDQEEIIQRYKIVVENKDRIISEKNKVLATQVNINKKLDKERLKYKNRAHNIPYFIGTGIIGGFALCLSLK